MIAPDVVVVGSGPNGLAAAVTMARAGLAVRVYEAAPYPGGGATTAELTLPGYHHDRCSSVHPMALASPFFVAFGLAERIELVTPDISYANPLPNGPPGIAYRDLDRTADELGTDGDAWLRLMRPLAQHAEHIARIAESHLLRLPPHPVTALRLALATLQQGSPAWNHGFREETAPAMLAGLFAHAVLPMPSLGAAATGLVLGAHAHARGWPIPIGGSNAITTALLTDLTAHGGELVLNTPIRSLHELPPARATFLDVTPRGFEVLAGDQLSGSYRRALRSFRYGPGVAKVDYALTDTIPWREPALADAGTLHLGGTRDQVQHSERAIAQGRHAPHAFVLASQPTRFDPNRAPTGKHTLYAYTHVPHGSTINQTEHITRTIEQHAPGFRDTILATHHRTAADLATANPNNPGGDITAGAATAWQLLKRPTLTTHPWTTPLPNLYLCSASTPPGPGVHGLAGYNAAKAALQRTFHLPTPPLHP